jgi:hypothetical protein
LQVRSTFAVNDIAFEDSSGVDHDTLYPGLKKALYNYMLGVGLEEDVRSWFDIPSLRRLWRRILLQVLFGLKNPVT